MAFQISLRSHQSVIDLVYNNGIRLNKPYDMCLKSFVTYNSIPNITPKNNKILFISSNNQISHTITVPTGTYELHDIIKYIQEHDLLKSSNTKMTLNTITMKIEITTAWFIDFNIPNSIGPILGYNGRIGPSIKHVSNLPVQIFNIHTIKIKCNLIKCNIDNLQINDNTIYEFPLSESPGEKIVERPSTLCYYPVNNDTINELNIKIVDQDNNLIDFRNELISLILDFRPRDGY